ncbi:hypothetical protein G9A89_005166 [Geosiphon pyriformis]|nr:hypothetical protein G9A89_005166 [Geosiphon pyriformis]
MSGRRFKNIGLFTGFASLKTNKSLRAWKYTHMSVGTLQATRFRVDFKGLNNLDQRYISSTVAAAQQYFDTNKFVQKLESEGFTREQSEAFMNSLTEVMNESMQTITQNLVTKAEQEKTVYTSKVDFAQLKSEIQMFEKNDASLMKAENERLIAEIEKLKSKMNEEIRRTQAGVRLDLNLEKGRIRDEASALELKIKETETRIESEISNLRTQMETTKFQILQYMLGTLTGAGALILAYMRMFR